MIIQEIGIRGFKSFGNSEQTLKLNLPDVKKFVKLLSCIDSDLELIYDNNNLSSQFTRRVQQVPFALNKKGTGLVRKP